MQSPALKYYISLYIFKVHFIFITFKNYETFFFNYVLLLILIFHFGSMNLFEFIFISF